MGCKFEVPSLVIPPLSFTSKSSAFFVFFFFLIKSVIVGGVSSSVGLLWLKASPSPWMWKSRANASVWFCLGADGETPPHMQICRWQLFSVSPITDSRMILLNTRCHYLLLVTHHFANWQRAMEGFSLDCWALRDVLKRGGWLLLQIDFHTRHIVRRFLKPLITACIKLNIFFIGLHDAVE